MADATIAAYVKQDAQDAGAAPAQAGPQPRFLQDQVRYKKPFNLAAALTTARARTGKRYGEMVKEIFRLGRGNGKLTPSDYFYFALYDDKRFTWDTKTRFMSDHAHAGVIAKCCERSWWAVADDKLLAYGLLRQAGIAVPETQAVLDRSGRGFAGLRHLTDLDDLSRFLRREAVFPLFAKPLGGVASFGALKILGYADGTLTIDNGETLALDDLAREIGTEQSYLFQTLLRPHPAIAAVSDTVSTIRVMIAIGAEGPKVLRTVWKIPGKGSIADNFWRAGNLLGAVDPLTGRVKRVIQGTGADLAEVTAHPDSNVPLIDRELPDWKRLMDMALTGARLFYPLRYQSWDIAMEAQGPVAVEVNTGSAFNLAQLAWGEGILTDEFCGFLRGCGYKLKT